MNKNYKTPLTREEIFTELSRLQKMNKLYKTREQAQKEKAGANHLSWRSWIRKMQQAQKEKAGTRVTSAIPPSHSPMPLSASDDSRLQKMNKNYKTVEQAQKEKAGIRVTSALPPSHSKFPASDRKRFNFIKSARPPSHSPMPLLAPYDSYLQKKMNKDYKTVEQTQKEKRGTRVTSAIPPSHSPMPLSASDKEMLCLYQNIDSLLPNSPNKIIQFISSRQGEGVSTTVHAFGQMTATRLRKEVIIFDASKSVPGQHLLFGITPDHSWEGILRDDGVLELLEITPEHSWEDILRDDGVFEKVLYRGKKPNMDISPVSPNSALTHHVFDSSRVESFWKKLKERFDLVLVDSPAAAVSPSGIAISRHVDGVVLVVEAENTRWPVVENVKETIKRNSGNILGVVFNKRRYYIPDFIYRIL